MGAMKQIFTELMEAVAHLDATGNIDELNKVATKYGDDLITIGAIEEARQANQAMACPICGLLSLNEYADDNQRDICVDCADKALNNAD